MQNAADKSATCRRYTDVPFPPYRFVPGEAPHPRRHRHGHSFGRSEPKPVAFRPVEWSGSREYLFGVDLFNFGYWWESHEQFEALWHAFGHQGPEGMFFKGLIQLSAACLKRRMQNSSAATKLMSNACALLVRVPSHYMGLDIHRLIEHISGVEAAEGADIHLYLEPPQVDFTVEELNRKRKTS